MLMEYVVIVACVEVDKVCGRIAGAHVLDAMCEGFLCLQLLCILS